MKGKVAKKYTFNPLVPSFLNIGRTFGQNFNLGRNPQKISYKRRDYELVDEKSLS